MLVRLPVPLYWPIGFPEPYGGGGELLIGASDEVADAAGSGNSIVLASRKKTMKSMLAFRH